MALKNVDIPFNKDLAPITMGKEAIDALEGLFDIIEREGLSPEQQTQWVAGHVQSLYEHWGRKFPKKDKS